jgi:hypothetical protein
MTDVKILWDDNASDEDNYVVERSDGDNLNFVVLDDTLPPDTTSYVDQGVLDGTYYYRTKAVNTFGSSAYSNELRVDVPHVAAKVAQYYGDAGNTISTDPVVITGDLELRAVVTFGENPGGGSRYIIGNNTAAEPSYRWYVNTNADIIFNGSTDGSTTNISAAVDISTLFFKGMTVELRCLRSATNGNVSHWWRPVVDGVGSGVFIQIGVTLTGRPTGPLSASTARLHIGNTGGANGLNAWLGNIHRAIVYNGWNGTKEVIFEPDDAPGYGTLQSWTGKETGQVFTAIGDVRISAVNTLVVDSFTDSNGTDIVNHTPDIDLNGNGWNTTAGYFEIQSEEFTKTLSGSGWADIDTENVDVQASVDIVSHSGGGIGISMRNVQADPVSNFNPTWRVHQSSGGALEIWEPGVVRASAADTTTLIGTMFAAVSGDVITGWKDDGVSVSYTPITTGSASGRTGLYINNGATNLADMDNFKVTSITETPL